MTEERIIVMTDDGFTEWANGVKVDAMQYAQLCIKVLVEKYDAVETDINQTAILEMSVGYLINCLANFAEPVAPEDFIKERLVTRSDYGLLIWGLTRAQYRKALHSEAEGKAN